MKFKKFIPTVLLLAGLGLGFNIPDYEKVYSTEQKLELSQGPIFEDVLEKDKKYTLEEVKYKEYPNKSFEVTAHIDLLDKKVDVTYSCGTNAKGEFDSENLDLSIGYGYDAREEGKISQLDISGEKESSGLFANYVDVYFYSFDSLLGILAVEQERFGDFLSNRVRKDVERNAPYVTEEIRKYFDFGTRQLNVFSKLLDIEEKKKNSKGRNIYHVLKELDISKLSAKDVDLNRIWPSATVDSIKITLRSYKKFIVLAIEDIDSKTYNSKNMMTILDEDKDGSIESVNLNRTRFEIKDNNYEYIEELYTKEQVENIFKDAKQKLELINKVLGK